MSGAGADMLDTAAEIKKLESLCFGQIARPLTTVATSLLQFKR